MGVRRLQALLLFTGALILVLPLSAMLLPPVYGVELNPPQTRLVYTRPENITIDSYGGGFWQVYVSRAAYFTLDSSGNLGQVNVIEYCHDGILWFSICLASVSVYIYDYTGALISQGSASATIDEGSVQTIAIPLSTPVFIGDVERIEVVTGSGWGPG